MAHLETDRLAREARIEGGARVERCLGCGAWVLVRTRDVINRPELIGECRCLCGLIWEVRLHSPAA